MFRPLSNNVLVLPDAPATETPTGIILPDKSKEKPDSGTVIAVGPGRKDDNGKLIPPQVKVGDSVYFAKYGGHTVDVAGKDHLVMPENHIIGIKIVDDTKPPVSKKPKKVVKKTTKKTTKKK